jgi:hypothetical protein
VEEVEPSEVGGDTCVPFLLDAACQPLALIAEKDKEDSHEIRIHWCWQHG